MAVGLFYMKSQENPQTSKGILLSILTIESAKDLVKHKSFIILIFFILIADHLLRSRFNLGHLKKSLSFSSIQSYLPEFLFSDLPSLLSEHLLSPSTLGILIGLFIFKQAVSLWPSSSLRRWHHNNENAGMMNSLLSLKITQIVWDFCALGILGALIALWGGISYLVCYRWWEATNATLAAWCFVANMGLLWPLIMAGLSFSSKLAVLQHGGFTDKFKLFLKLFSNRRILIGSWLFYLARIVLEMLFVAIIPVGALLYIDNPVLRTFLICASVTPSYSYLKMASFKFFLFIYYPYEAIKEEFHEYYQAMDSTALNISKTNLEKSKVQAQI